MEQSYEARLGRLLKVTADIQKQMTRLRALREAVRATETLAVLEPIDPAFGIEKGRIGATLGRLNLNGMKSSPGKSHPTVLHRL